MSEEIKITEVEVQKIQLNPGDTLMVTVKHPDMDMASLVQLREQLTYIYPNNKVAIFAVGDEGFVKFHVVSSIPMSYCSDCDCGKKEQAEAAKEEQK